jgi:hypothetical protein
VAFVVELHFGSLARPWTMRITKRQRRSYRKSAERLNEWAEKLDVDHRELGSTMRNAAAQMLKLSSKSKLRRSKKKKGSKK